tara:strand:+ start:2881 stop:3798 length:918 start_codon:yes stop_codon:yes gene_type:complete
MEEIIKTSNAEVSTASASQAPAGDTGIAAENPTVGAAGGDAVSPTSEVAPEQSAQTDAVQNRPVKEDPTRYEYWQSQYDRQKSETSRIQSELEKYKQTLAPISEAINRDPNIMRAIDQSLSNGAPQGQPQMRNQGNSLQQPVAPEKPHSYSEVEAYNDPESESFKYRLQKEQYRDSMIDYYGKVDQYRAQQQQQAAMIQRQAAAESDARSYAIQNLGWDENKANKAIQWMQNPANVNFPALFKLYESLHAKDPKQVEAQRRVAEMQNQQERAKIPTTTAVATGRSEAPMNDENAFSQALFQNAKR